MFLTHILLFTPSVFFLAFLCIAFCTTSSPHRLWVAILFSPSLIPGTGPGPRKVWQRIRATLHLLPFSRSRLHRRWRPFQTYPVLAACCFGPSCPLVRCRTDSERLICPFWGGPGATTHHEVKNFLQHAQLHKENPTVNSQKNTKKLLLEKPRPFHYVPVSTM